MGEDIMDSGRIRNTIKRYDSRKDDKQKKAIQAKMGKIMKANNI